MSTVTELQSGDEVQCPHCGRWHQVRRAFADAAMASHTHLYVTFQKRKRRFPVGTVGFVPQWPWRRPTDPQEGGV